MIRLHITLNLLKELRMRNLLAIFLSFGLFSSQALAIEHFELPWMNHELRGEIYRTTDHPNGVFVIEAYFIGCPACNHNVPNVKDLAQDYEAEPRVQILDVGRDCRDSDYVRWIQRHNPPYPVLNDCQRQVIGALNVRAYPTTVVLNCHGEEVYRTVGVWNHSARNQIRAAINGALMTECSVE